MSRKIISLEGAPCSGKSTLRANLEASFNDQGSYLFLPTIEEQKRFKSIAPKYPHSYEEARRNEDWFLEREGMKFQRARGYHADFGNAIVERDYLSTLAFSHAFSQYSGINSFPDLLKKYETSSPVQPDLRILLVITPKEILNRNELREKKLDNVFFNLGFLTLLSQYFNNYSSSNTLVYDSLMAPKEILESVKERIEGLK